MVTKAFQKTLPHRSVLFKELTKEQALKFCRNYDRSESGDYEAATDICLALYQYYLYIQADRDNKNSQRILNEISDEIIELAKKVAGFGNARVTTMAVAILDRRNEWEMAIELAEQCLDSVQDPKYGETLIFLHHKCIQKQCEGSQQHDGIEELRAS